MNLNHCDKWWLAIQVRPHYEFITAQILQNKGYEEFVPTYLVKRQWSDRQKVVRLPLFTGYVFCKFNAEICWPIVTTPGVIRIVGSGKGISRIDDHEIEAIRAVAECEVNVRPYRHLTVGSKGRVVKGALAGIEGIVITHKNHRRLVLSLDLIQSSIAIDVDRCEVELTSCTEKCGEPRHVLFPATQSRAI